MTSGILSGKSDDSVLVAPSAPVVFDPMDCSPPGSSVRGIIQAKILEWVAISFSRGSSRPRDQSQVSCFAGRFFIVWATKEAAGQVTESPGTQDKGGGVGSQTRQAMQLLLWSFCGLRWVAQF